MEKFYAFLSLLLIANLIISVVLNDSFSNQKFRIDSCYICLFPTEITGFCFAIFSTSEYKLLFCIMFAVCFILSLYSYVRYLTKKKDWRDTIKSNAVCDIILLFFAVFLSFVK